MAKLIFVKGDKKTEVEAQNGLSILEVAEQNNIELYGNCGGNCACGSCHIYIDEEHLSQLEKPKEEEENVLDIVFNLQQNSRLACQVFVCDELDGAIITIPE